ncbi:MAG: aspartyl/asparaginyl beta-hydroxylase domain-containing protein [Acidobacteria bacterium]|nr:aspartyl/asparaginyl beta-hydroxylase domain-containing protein [Acidobacteriota bacterium]
MKSRHKFSLQFDPARLCADLGRVAPDEWVRHYNQLHYEGEWSVAPLRSIGGRTKQIFPDPHAVEPFADTEILARCDYIREALAALDCEKQAVRLMRLGAGGKIREHRDYFMGAEHNCLRLHIPIATSDGVGFYHEGERVPMRAGELWYLDFGRLHSVENNGPTDRVHLVIDCGVSDWLLAELA